MLFTTMLNTKETLKKLHTKFPLLTLDELFDILDCYVEEINIKWDTETITTYPWYNGTLTCNDSLAISKFTPENKIIAKKDDISANTQRDF